MFKQIVNFYQSQLPWLSSIVYNVALNVPAMYLSSFYIVLLRKPVTMRENPLLFK